MTTYEIITRKRDGKQLSKDEINHIIQGFTDGTIPDYQMAAFLMAVFFRGMDDDETRALTEAMLYSGQVVDLSHIDGIKVDKHSTGGVGDKVSIILAPIVAAAGIPVPMISGRGLGHTGGTLDKLESIPGFRVDFSLKEYARMVEHVGTCLIGQTPQIVPADKKMYALRDVTATVQSIPLITSSIMSKKLAEGIDALVLDVKTGRGAFMQSFEDSELLARKLIAVGEKFGKPTVAYMTRMDQPLGFAVGNWLEILECRDALLGYGPADLMEVTHQLCGAMIYLGKKAASIDEGIRISQEMIESGRAWEKFLEIIRAQGGDPKYLEEPRLYPAASHITEISAPQDGFISSIDALEAGLAAIALGAGRQKTDDAIDPKAGIVFNLKCGDSVKKGEALFTLHTDRPGALEDITRRLLKAITFSKQAPPEQPLIVKYLDKNDL